MPDTASPQASAAMQVLVVDDEVNLRFAIERRLRKESIETASASTVRQAMERLRVDAFDAVLCDLKMPGGDGTQLLQWLASYSPSTPVIVVSAFVTSEFRSQYSGGQNLRILEKPVDLDVLVSTLIEIGPRRGFYGNAIEVELFDYVQMMAVSGRDKLIEVRTPHGVGLIWFEHGDIVHVQYGEFRGETAFYKLLATNRGTFREQFYRNPPIRTIHRSSTHLLMEAARQADEGILGQTPAGGRREEEETSFRGLVDEALAAAGPVAPVLPIVAALPSETVTSSAPAAADSTSLPIVDDDELVLPADDDETGLDELPTEEVLLADEAQGPGPTPGPEPASDRDVAATTGHGVFDDPETRQILLDQFWQFDGVNGVAIISSTGKVLAEDMRSNSALVTLAGFYMRGAARIARDLGYNVFDGVIARSTTGQQMVMVSMGATSAVLSVEIGCDPEVIRDAVLGDV